MTSMLLRNWVGLKILGCDVPIDITQRWVCPFKLEYSKTPNPKLLS